jgi:hypothetical protein
MERFVSRKALRGVLPETPANGISKSSIAEVGSRGESLPTREKPIMV